MAGLRLPNRGMLGPYARTQAGRQLLPSAVLQTPPSHHFKGHAVHSKQRPATNQRHPALQPGLLLLA